VLIIWGTKAIGRTLDKGYFYCPACQASQEYHAKEWHKFFTLFFIPILPIKLLGTYVECAACVTTYYPAILEKHEFDTHQRWTNEHKEQS
jgi:hypothetical protein